jgi:hypothetical protein
MSSIPDPMTALPETDNDVFEDPIMEEVHDAILENETTFKKPNLSAWQIEACAVDRSVQILPGVKRVINSIPNGRYAVATSGAKTYGSFTLSTSCHKHLTLLFQLMAA